MLFDIAGAGIVERQLCLMLLPELFLVTGLEKLPLNKFVRLVLTDIVYLFVQELDSVLRGAQRFLRIAQFGGDVLQPGGEIVPRVIAVLLNIADGSGHFLQIGNLHFPGISRALLCLNVGLQVNDQMQI